MNKTQKKIVSDSISTIEKLIADVQGVQSDLQDDFDSKSEKWQEGEKGEELSERINTFDSIIEQLEGAKTDLDNTEEA